MAQSPLGMSALIGTLAVIAAVLAGCGGSPTPAPTPPPGPQCEIKQCNKVTVPSAAQDCSQATCEECSADSVADCAAASTPKGTKDCASQASCKDCKIDHCTAVNTPAGTKNCQKQATCKTCDDKYHPFTDSQGGFCGLTCSIENCKDQAPDRGAKDCSKATCSHCDEKYALMSDAKGSYCGLDCPLEHCKYRAATPRDAKSCPTEVTSPCLTCEEGYEITLNRSTLMSTGNCTTECTQEQIQQGCARHTCKPDGSCECVPGFTKSAEATKETVARFLGDMPRMETCSKDAKPAKMTFYMYRAQDDQAYPPDCTDLASAAGVLFYLHNEVVTRCYEFVTKGGKPTKTPRHYGITRIIRYQIEMMNTQKVFDKQQGQFSHYVPFDAGKCTYNQGNCTDEFDTYGYSVGCQSTQPDPAVNRTYLDNSWYSLPGACPQKNYSEKASDKACKSKFPGGNCSSPDGKNDCTWHVVNETPASVYLDELSGIAPEPFKYDPTFFLKWCTFTGQGAGNVEYNAHTDKGVGTTFWDDKGNATRNKERVLRLLQLFAKHYPAKDALEFQPYCDGF